MNGDTADIIAHHLALAGMQARTNLDAERLDLLSDGAGAADAARRPVKGRQKAVAGGFHLAAAEASENAPDRGVVVVKQTAPAMVPECGCLLRRTDNVGEENRGEDAIGLDPGGCPREEFFDRIGDFVGIVADVRSRAVSEPAVPAIFLPHGEHPDVFRPTLVIRSALPPDALTASVRARLRVFDPALLLLRARPMGEVVAGALSRPRFNLLLIASFAAVGLALGSIGIYGVVALLVTERTREIGIRIALGARPANVLRLVVSEGMAPVLPLTVR